MQPYFFPYIGYYQLVNSVDKFIFYDDVNFIKGGWINRNRILVNGGINYMNLIMKEASPFKVINSIEIDSRKIWREKLIKKIELSYKNAPFFKDVFGMISEVIFQQSNYLSDICKASITKLSEYLNIRTNIVYSSSFYNNAQLKSSKRVIDICKLCKASCYINALGGQELYDKQEFAKENLELKFLQTNLISYEQFNNQFVPNLSIIDVVMFNDREKILTQFLPDFQLI